MTDSIREKIMMHAEFYLDEKGFSANEFCEMYGIPANYFSYMRKGVSHIEVSGKKVLIDDKYYRLIANAIDHDISESQKLWDHVDTLQSTEILSKMEESKKYGFTNVIISKTGTGKSYCRKAFIKLDPKNNFKIIVSPEDNISDFIENICEELKIPLIGSKSKKIKNIIKELKRHSLNDRSPTITFDECEFMKLPTLANIKELYDSLENHCGLIFLGTPEFYDKLIYLKTKGKPGMAQLYRRLKWRITILQDIDTRFPGFLEDIEDKGLVKFLQTECENYGELHDVLVPARREVLRLGEALSEDLVRKMLNLPKPK